MIPREVPREELQTAAVRLLEEVATVLDIGPGIRPQTYIRPLVHVCAEPFHQYVEKLQAIAAQATDRTYVVLQMTWQEVVKVFPENSVDTVVLSDVIEHLEKEEGRALLEATQRIARRQIAVFTTLGFVPQHHPDGKDAWGLDGGVWQEHRSGWLPEDFGEGWQVLMSRDFHYLDNMNRPRAKPEGALWAVFTRSREAKPDRRRHLVDLWRAAVECDSVPATQWASYFLRAIEPTIARIRERREQRALRKAG